MAQVRVCGRSRVPPPRSLELRRRGRCHQPLCRGGRTRPPLYFWWALCPRRKAPLTGTSPWPQEREWRWVRPAPPPLLAGWAGVHFALLGHAVPIFWDVPHWHLSAALEVARGAGGDLCPPFLIALDTVALLLWMLCWGPLLCCGLRHPEAGGAARASRAPSSVVERCWGPSAFGARPPRCSRSCTSPGGHAGALPLPWEPHGPVGRCCPLCAHASLVGVRPEPEPEQ